MDLTWFNYFFCSLLVFFLTFFFLCVLFNRVYSYLFRFPFVSLIRKRLDKFHYYTDWNDLLFLVWLFIRFFSVFVLDNIAWYFLTRQPDSNPGVRDSNSGGNVFLRLIRGNLFRLLDLLHVWNLEFGYFRLQEEMREIPLQNYTSLQISVLCFNI